MKIIVPMAGLGTRFSKAADKNPEYKKPKPFIMVRNHPMVRWATGSFPFIGHADQPEDERHHVRPEDLIFIILKEHDDAHFLSIGLRQIYSDSINIIVLPQVTRGAAETAYQARHLVADDESVLITDSDHFFDGHYLYEAINNKHPETAGIITVFRAPKEEVAKCSYSLVKDGTNVIVRVAEKDRELMELGAHANIGAYFFSKAKHFFDVAKEVITKGTVQPGVAGKNEFYIAPLYQKLIDKGMRVEAAFLPKVWMLGTPEDLEDFIKHSKIEKPWQAAPKHRV